MFPYPSGRRSARRSPRGLHRDRHRRALQAHARLRRAAPDGLGRLRPARRAARDRDRHAPARDDGATTSRPSSASSRCSASATTGRARSTPPIPATYAGRSGSSCSCSERGLAYQATVPVNWCPALGTVLANEEVIDGKSERGGHPVERMPLRQWMLRSPPTPIGSPRTSRWLDWPEGTLTTQRDWIGRSRGRRDRLRCRRSPGRARSPSSRPGPTRSWARPTSCSRPSTRSSRTLATPAQREAVVAYVEAAARKSDLDRADLAKTKTGRADRRACAIHPITGELACRSGWPTTCLARYGTGAVMAVPGHDERDFEFATPSVFRSSRS